MLQKMRSFSKSIVSTIFMGVLALSFAVWGIADIFRGRADTNVVTVGSTEVPYDLFSRDYRNFLRNEGQQAGHDIGPDEARKMGLGKVALDRIITRTALDNVINDLGLTASDADVSARIRRMTAFNGPLGTFDRSIFQRILQQRGFTEADFVEGVRGDIARNQLIAPFEDGFRVPRGYAHLLFAYSTEMRAAQYIVLTPQMVGTIPQPDDKTLTAYVHAHADRFSTPEYRDVTIAALSPEDVSGSIKVTDAQLKQEYEARKSTHVIPETRDVQQISFSDEASAKEAKAKIDGGATFEQAAFAAKKTVDDRGSVSKEDLGPLGDATFALPLNGVTAPLKSFSGWVLLHVSKITPGSTTTFDQAKPELTKIITDQLAQSKLIDAANAYTDAVSSGDEFADAAKKAGMRVIHIAAVDSHGLGPDGQPAGIPNDPDLLAQIFNADVGDSGDPFPTKLGSTYVVDVAGVTPPRLKPLDAVRADAARMWLAEETTKLLKQRATALAAQARRSGGLPAVAKQIGAPVLFGPAIGRGRASNIFSKQVVDDLFDVAPNGVVSGPGTKGDSYVVAQVTGVVHPPLPQTGPAYQQGLRELAGQIASDVTMSAATAARDAQGYTVNQKLFDQAVGAGGEGGS